MSKQALAKFQAAVEAAIRELALDLNLEQATTWANSPWESSDSTDDQYVEVSITVSDGDTEHTSTLSLI